MISVQILIAFYNTLDENKYEALIWFKGKFWLFDIVVSIHVLKQYFQNIPVAVYKITF